MDYEENIDEKEQVLRLYHVFKKTVENLYEEYDLDDLTIGQILLQVVDEFTETDIEFEADFSLEDDE
jgi:glucose-6-phosphate-specific signal transduction histidine kinase